MQTTTTGKKKNSLHNRAISYFSFHHIGIEQSHANNNHRKNKKKGGYTTSGQATYLFLGSDEAADGTDEAAGPASSLVVAADPPPTLLSAPLILLLTTLGVTWCACGGRCATLPVHTSTHANKVLPKGTNGTF